MGSRQTDAQGQALLVSNQESFGVANVPQVAKQEEKEGREEKSEENYSEEEFDSTMKKEGKEEGGSALAEEEGIEDNYE